MIRALLPLLLIAASFGCDTDSPTAPIQTPAPPVPATVSVASDPATVDSGATSTITVTATLSGGAPPNGSTAVVSTNLGTFPAGQSTAVTFDASGSARLTFTAPDEAGVATIRAQFGDATGSTTVTITAEEGQVSVQPDVELDHNRSTSMCEDPIEPLIEVDNLGNAPIDFRVISDLPDWLRAEPMTGVAPGTFRLLFTCKVGSGDLDLTHRVRVQGESAATGEEEGEEDSILVTVRVRG